MRFCIFIFFYTIRFANLKVYTKFHNPESSSYRENSGEKCPYDCVTHVYRSDSRKNENLKKKAERALSSLFSFTHYTYPT